MAKQSDIRKEAEEKGLREKYPSTAPRPLEEVVEEEEQKTPEEREAGLDDLKGGTLTQDDVKGG